MACIHTDSLRRHLDNLQIECHSNSQQYRDQIEVVMKHYRNLLTKDPKYRRMRITTFTEKHPRPSVLMIMLSAGWEKDDIHMYYKGDDACTRELMKLLADERTVVVPNSSEWVDSNKVENIDYTGWQDAVEKKRRAEKEIERIKDLEKFAKDVAERKQAAENVLKNIRADNAHRKKQQQQADTQQLDHELIAIRAHKHQEESLKHLNAPPDAEPYDDYDRYDNEF